MSLKPELAKIDLRFRAEYDAARVFAHDVRNQQPPMIHYYLIDKITFARAALADYQDDFFLGQISISLT